ncbi:MAG: methyltransferase domain-containing protein [Actinomycetota bacterium]|nr:methyltransferase domain-containing protein [Actinomycetota bacterium]
MTFTNVPIDAVRRYWDTRPCNVRHSKAPQGTREYFDQVEHRKYLVEPHIPSFANFAQWHDQDVLEIGCGIGTDTINFARAGARVTAVDLSSESIAIARQRAELFGLQDRIQFINCNAEALTETLGARTFDLIYSFGVIHHTPHPEAVIGQAHLLSKPGTTLKVMVYHRRSVKVFATVVLEGHGDFRRSAEIIAKNSEAQTGCPVTYTYTRQQGRRLLEQGGFRVENCAIAHIFPYRVAEYVEHRYVYKRWVDALPPYLFRKLERVFGWHLLLTATVD